MWFQLFMCGIAGFVTKRPDDFAAVWAAKAQNLLSHRGPDGTSTASWDRTNLCVSPSVRPGSTAGLVHNRLSIIDLSALGDQPMSTADGRLHMVFNGEIYNYVELREELAREHGVTFVSQSDGEVLLAAWAVWGHSCLNRLIGMFALAILDTRAGKLYLARDPVGIKPLFYVNNAQGLAFASEPAPLLEWPGTSRKVDPQGVVDYLRFGFTDHLPTTMFQDVLQLRAGTWAEVSLRDPSEMRVETYWSPTTRPTLETDRETAVARLRELLFESVELHLRADVPVACCLSGGIDSSSIAMLMRHVGGPKLEIHTFSHVAPGTPFDEQVWIDTVNAECGAVSHKIESSAEDLVRDLPDLVRKQQVPFSTTSIYAQNRVFQCLHEHGLKVTLDGQGADELFGGYGFHIGARIGSLIKSGNWAKAQALLQRAGQLPGQSKKGQLGNALDYVLPSGLQKAVRKAGGKEVAPAWFNASWCAQKGVSPDPYRTGHSRELLREALCRSLKGPGLPHLLRYEDQNSMAYSVESRVPFLAQPILEFALALPEEFLVSDQAQTKTLLRQAMRGIVPDVVLDRKDKVAFQTPESDWFKSLEPWMDGVLSSDAAGSCAALDMGQAKSHWDRVKSGASPYTPVVWRWVNLIEWSRQFGVQY